MLLPFTLAFALSLAPVTPPAAETTASATATAPWFVAPGGQRSGPLTNEQIAAEYLGGRIGDSTLAWRDGDAQWQPLAQTSGFVELDRWYVRQGERSHGPIAGAELRRMLGDARRQGRDLSQLSVRLEWSPSWISVAGAAPLVSADLPARVGGRRTPSGTPLIVEGALMMGFGSLAFFTGVGFAAHRWEPVEGVEAKYKAKVWAPPLAVGLAMMVGSIPLLAVGAHRNRVQRAGARGAVAVIADARRCVGGRAGAFLRLDDRSRSVVGRCSRINRPRNSRRTSLVMVAASI